MKELLVVVLVGALFTAGIWIHSKLKKRMSGIMAVITTCAILFVALCIAAFIGDAM